jgi:predicted dehydrogenase
MSEHAQATRREFFGWSAAAAGAGTVAAVPAVSSTILNANDTIRLGLIGCGPQGKNDLFQCLKAPKTAVVALCDVDPARLRGTLEKSGGKVDTYADFRRVLDRKDIDAVIVATPDHWHAIPALQAIRSGKDVYLEKPVGHTVREGQLLVETARRHQRIVQVGLQQRSGGVFQEAARLVRSGKIGQVSEAHCFNTWNMTPGGTGRALPIGNPPDSDPPEGVDYEMWLGPAPKRPFNPNRFHWNYIYFWDYSGGMTIAWGVHLVDIVLWIMQVKGPRAVAVSGGKYVLRDARETPDTLQAVFDFPGFTLTYSCRHANRFPMGSRWLDHGIQFLGTRATLLVDRTGYQIIPEGEKPEPVSSPEGLSGGNGPHQQDFLDCVRSRKTPACEILEGHRSTVAMQLANIAFRTNRKVHWDPDNEKIAGDPGAAALLSKQYRPPWSLV